MTKIDRFLNLGKWLSEKQRKTNIQWSEMQ